MSVAIQAESLAKSFGTTRALDGVEGLERLRFTSPNPKDFRDDVVEAMAYDCYSHPSDPTNYSTAPDMFARVVAKADELGIPFGIAEVGSRLAQGDSSGEKRAEWLRYIANWVGARDGAFMSYFDSYAGGEFRLLDEPSRAAWHEVVTTY